MTGIFSRNITESFSQPGDPRVYKRLAARIVNADQKKVGVYNNNDYTFELAAPGEAAEPRSAAAAGFRAVRALRAKANADDKEAAAAAKLGQGRRRRKSKKSKYRSRKTRRTRR
jgi:hypothetical protein